ncbi:MAG: hypothetical protein V2I79_12915 [Xanthomonadales bacterium]|jgi:hypothetical protein|nr:hypothetical protein [Xanthomonadales bacterium]
MLRSIIVLITLLFSASTLAESVLYVCERPAWDGKTGCGPNNTYSTHTFLVDTDDFDDEKPIYVYQGGKGCDVSKKSRFRHHYAVTPENFVFKYARAPRAPRDKLWATFTLDRESMTATLSKTKHASELTCRVEKVD